MEEASETYIELCPYNQTSFSLDENIKLSISLKNVPTMHLKVYEINTEAYLRKNMADFSSDTDLDGLVANYEKVYDYTKMPPNVRHVEKVDLRSDD